MLKPLFYFYHILQDNSLVKYKMGKVLLNKRVSTDKKKEDDCRNSHLHMWLTQGANYS